MTYSEIKITFTQDLKLEDSISFKRHFTGSDTFFETTEVWKDVRSSTGQVAIGVPTNILGERSAISYIQSFNLDYNSSGLFQVTRIENTVSILSNDPEIKFSIDGILSNSSEAIILINNFEGNIFDINEVTFSQAIKPSTHIKVNVITNELATSIISPIEAVSNTSNPFEFEYLRGGKIQFICKNKNGQEAKRTINLPDVLNAENVQIQVNISSSGSTVISNVSNDFGLELEYSLNALTWKEHNIFNGISDGSYTLYIKDQYGSVISKKFIVDAFGIDNSYFFISKSNSIRFAKRVVWNDCSNYKNDENTLSCEASVPLPYTEIQQFQSCDIITTQFKSNYSNHYVNVVNDNNESILIPVLKKSQSMRLKDMRDARKFNLGNGKTGIYFLHGNTYNYNTGLVSSIYTLNGALPYWARSGFYIELEGRKFLIEDISYDRQRNAEVIVINNKYLGSDTIVKVSTLYNRFNYEVYEFAIDMANFNNQNIKVSLVADHNVFGQITYLSEFINIKVRHENTVEIRYNNRTNTDIFYSTGIEHKLRMPIEKIIGKVSDENEVHKTDTNAILLRAENYELDEFEFQPVTKQIMYKVVQALSHSNVVVDGVAYVKNESINVEGPLEDTNLYEIKATMIKDGNAFIGQGTGDDITIGTPDQYVPPLIESDNGYIKY